MVDYLSRRGYAVVSKADLDLEIPYSDPAIEPEYKQLCDEVDALGADSGKHKRVHYTTYCAIKYVIDNDIPGDIVECGVGKGGKVMLICSFLRSRGVTDRPVYLYDTFAGMTAPSIRDRKIGGRLSAAEVAARFENSQRETHNTWCYGSKAEVMANVYATGYPPERLRFVEGDVCRTLPNDYHSKIALLRLDTDFYESTLQELTYLYKYVVPRGVVILDDYGGWQGHKEAADEFFRTQRLAPFLVRTCRHERVLIKDSA